ncbi:MAG: hypothetical protein MUE40_16565 [Anaerolineae bacterium]|nr:hypothetical protein [Anaerolineae bacterium]
MIGDIAPEHFHPGRGPWQPAAADDADGPTLGPQFIHNGLAHGPRAENNV